MNIFILGSIHEFSISIFRGVYKMNNEFVEKVETTCQNNSDCRALFGTRDSDPVIDLLGLQQNHMSPKPQG